MKIASPYWLVAALAFLAIAACHRDPGQFLPSPPAPANAPTVTDETPLSEESEVIETGEEESESEEGASGAAYFLVELPGPDAERFVVAMTDPRTIAEARAIIAGRQGQKIVSGRLVSGSGGYNRDPLTGREWSWHLDPASIELAEMTIELCDGRPSFVQDDPSYWLSSVGQFCPWTGVLRKELDSPS
jgi:hypothetical protein